ncbi:MAG TPA: deoxyuridine 5'-triphosphate nucleotidohydrolase [Candidatus Methanofastidiosa archaeon]|nr:deoxyuridine 5'-triphosphate nucleotidohydrolase [Candidatus Methanofastidiosa archaeon]
MGAFSKNKIMDYISNDNMLERQIDTDVQVTNNGIDLTLEKVERLTSPGYIDFSNEERVISGTEEMPFDERDWIFLERGTYKITYNEVISIPKDAIALARTRSSLLRCGASIGTGVWDAGYRGRSSSLLYVSNDNGIYLKRNARVLQLVFFDLDTETESYSGTYQNENCG